jgi:hypothetical protein
MVQKTNMDYLLKAFSESFAFGGVELLGRQRQQSLE